MPSKRLYTDKLFKIIDEESKTKENGIFVILGDTNLVEIDHASNFMADIESFYLTGNDQIFSKAWFSKIFSELNILKEYHLISFAQFSYLIFYIDSSFFADRICIIKDNIRQLFPLEKGEYYEREDNENMELRPAELPIYHSEQFSINDKYYYSVRTPINSFKTIPLFNEGNELAYSNDLNLEFIDISSDPYSLDIFINKCFEQNYFAKRALVKYYDKQPLNPVIIEMLKNVNFILHQFGGELFFLKEVPVQHEYELKDSIMSLLKQYWGGDSKFRDLAVYKNPNIDNEIVRISQGYIVDIIINEYEKAVEERSCRDLFLTAPTGAGKSLLFQLPSFYVSEKGDVVIVVSPLIALMKDQVSSIINDRKYEKVAYINSELSLFDRDRIIESCKAGEIDILYMSPELLLSYDIRYFIGDRRIGLLVIDEAHLITTWGRDFRVDYWFLGNHIRKIRKYHNLVFPMVAVTATAIYGGANDMVFDSIDSLVMHNPHIFIGQVKRDDIEFIVANHERFSSNYEFNKISQTVEFIEGISKLGLKALVYAPYTRHIRQILDQLSLPHRDNATGYHGALDSINKEFAYRQFKNNEKRIMISTKAFGMGVDISDIQVVYHHAPSGLLPDYVQEIGRVARIPEMIGYAMLNYSSQDQRYTKALHGMSSLRQYQLREVLKKIHKAYLKNNKTRNLLLSVDDFGYIFENSMDIDQKVFTALMMIEKDYLAKYRFNVIVARPKKLFVKVYARIPDNQINILEQRYSSHYSLVKNSGNGYAIIELDLDQIWYEYFSMKSFPSLKQEFYSGRLLKGDGIDLIPQIKISFERLESLHVVFSKLQSLLLAIQEIFASATGFFNIKDFRSQLESSIADKEKCEKLAKFILSTYSGRQIQPGVIEGDAFLQQRRSMDGYEYRVFNTKYLISFDSLLKRLTTLFNDTESPVVDRFVTNKESNSINYVRLGYFLEIMDLGTFEVKGGENPMIFIRINDPQRLEFDSNRTNYTNSLLEKTLERHSLSNQIFDHFFLRGFTNEERWNFIEDFFLGSDVDILIDKYKGGDVDNANILEILKKKASLNLK